MLSSAAPADHVHDTFDPLHAEAVPGQVLLGHVRPAQTGATDGGGLEHDPGEDVGEQVQRPHRPGVVRRRLISSGRMPVASSRAASSWVDGEEAAAPRNEAVSVDEADVQALGDRAVQRYAEPGQ